MLCLDVWLFGCLATCLLLLGMHVTETGEYVAERDRVRGDEGLV